MIFNRLPKYICYYTAIIALLGTLIAVPSALADGADAELHDVEVTASPSSQGIGGIILVDATVYFYGGCCYHLYANDVTAELSVPDGIDINEGPTPEKYGEVDAEPGGKATVVHFKWEVKCNAQGHFDLNVLIKTANCGSMEDEAVVEVVQGCIISSPVTYPQKLSVNRENIISLNASTSIEGRSVENVTLFYVKGKEFRRGTPKNDTIYLNNGKEIKGVPIPMEQDPYIPEQWMCKLDMRNEVIINFWFVAKDDLGENTTSSLFSREVIDQEAIDEMVGAIFWVLFIGFLIGFILIYMIHGFILKRKESRSNILRLRAEHRTEKKLNRTHGIIALGLLIISLIIVVISLILGWIWEIIELSLG